MTSRSTFKALVFLHGKWLTSYSNVSRALSWYCRYNTGTLNEHTVHNVTKACNALARVREMWTFSKMVSTYLAYNDPWDVLEVISWKEKEPDPKFETYYSREVSVPLCERKEVSAEVWKRSTVVEKACQRWPICLWSTLTAHSQIMRCVQSWRNLERLEKYSIQSSNYPRES